MRRSRGEGTIYYSETEKRWTAQVTIAPGKRRTIHGKTQKEVLQKKTELLRQRDQGRAIAPSRQTVAAYLLEWLEGPVKMNRRPSTYDSYRSHIRQCLPYLEKRTMAQLQPRHLETMYAEMKDAYAPNTIKTTNAILHTAFDRAVRQDILIRNPVDAAESPGRVERQHVTLDMDSLRQLLDSAEGTRWHPLWVVLATTGIRPGEALGLQWSHVEPSAITIAHTLSSRGTLGPTKTERSRRTITLTPQGIAALKARRVQWGTDKLAAGPMWSGDDYVFSTLGGKPLNAGSVCHALYAALKGAGLPPMRVHDLRHTFATLCYERGVSPKIISQILGHANEGITLSLYGHVTPSMHDRTIELFGEHLRGAK